MNTKWIYKGDEYTTEADVNQAVLYFKSRLDNNPTDWAVVQELTGDAVNGWVVPLTYLTDSEINDLDQKKHYSVSSVIGGDSEVGLTATAATAKVLEYRGEFAERYVVNTIFKLYAPTNADMSGY